MPGSQMRIAIDRLIERDYFPCEEQANGREDHSRSMGAHRHDGMKPSRLVVRLEGPEVALFCCRKRRSKREG